jgi:hypothetical protein
MGDQERRMAAVEQRCAWGEPLLTCAAQPGQDKAAE